MRLPTIGASLLAPALGDRYERSEGHVQEPAQPDALAAAVVTDSVHAVVPIARPHQRQAVQPNGKAPIERRGTMLEQRGRVRRCLGLEVVVGLVRPQRGTLEVRHHLVEHRIVAGDREIPVDGVRKPDAVVGDPGPHATARRRVPPVLHVALGELAGGGTKQVLAGQVALGGHESEHVLQLIAEPVRAACLIERGPGPEPACQRLVDQPMVDHDVERPVGGAHLDRALHIVPVAHDIAQRRLVFGGPSPAHELGDGRRVGRLTEQHDHLGGSAVRHVERGLQRGARVEPGAAGFAEVVATVETGGSSRVTVATEELGAIRGPPRLATAEIEEGDMPGELGVPRVAYEECAGLGVECCDDPRRAGAARRAEHPFRVGGDRQSP